jgi:tRNA(Ile)-lysidine synthase
MSAAPAAPANGSVEAAFRRGIEGCGPFEPSPVVAVGLSGGGDSTALLLLTEAYCRSRGGHVVALTVDHRLRPESADEAEQVAAFCRERGIEHHVLTWRHGAITTGIQARARQARYRLMTGWCRDHGILHLALAHNRNDQTETREMRRSRTGNGPGIAGMPLVRLEDGVRILRPMLEVPGADLRRWLSGRRVGWIDDPSNTDRRFERIRVREDGAAGNTCPDDAAEARAGLEREAALLAAANLDCSPLGYARLRIAVLEEKGDGPAFLLTGVIAAISGATYRLPLRRGTDIALRLRSDGGRMTAGGCLLRRKDGVVTICREYARAPMTSLSALGGGTSWDGRFRLRQRKDGNDGDMIGPAFRSGRSMKELSARTGVPGDVLRGLPGHFRDGSWLGFATITGADLPATSLCVQFSPRNAIAPVARWLVPAADEPMLALVNKA